LRDLNARVRALPWSLPRAPALLAWTLLLAVAAAVRFLLDAAAGILLLAFAWAVLGAGLLAALSRTFLGPVLGKPLGAFEAGFEALKRSYERVLRWSLEHRLTTVGIAGVAFYLSLRIFLRLGSELIPEVHQGEFTADVRLAVGSRIEKTDSVLRPLEEKLLRGALELGIASATTTVGVEKDSIHAGDEGEHSAKILIRLKAGQDLRGAEEKVKARFREILASEAELSSYKFQNPVIFSFKTPIEVEVKGYNLGQLRKITTRIEEGLRSNPSLKDVKSNVASGYPEVELHFDREILSRYDLSVGSVGDVIREKVQGQVPTYFNEGDRKIGLRVRLLEEDRKSLEDLAGLIVNPGAAAQVRLSDVAEIRVSEGPSEIRRIDQQRAGVVTANLSGVDLGRVTREVEGVIRDARPPDDFLVGFGGQKEEMDQSLQSLGRALLLAVFLVYVVMAVQFESLLDPLVILVSVPLALVGVSPLLWALGISLSIVVLIGAIILAGIVVNNAIVLIDCVNHLRSRGAALEEALVEAGKIRLRPILMTTLTTVLGLLPLTGWFSGIPFLEVLLGTGEGEEIRAPLAITVISGLSASTLLTLVVVPVVYSLTRRRERRGTAEESHG